MTTEREITLMTEELRRLSDKIDSVVESTHQTSIAVAVIQHELATQNKQNLSQRVRALETFKARAIGYGSAAMVTGAACVSIVTDYIKGMMH